MTATLAITFPLGRYHATPWDRSVNEGAVEWPPSPWRLLRALVATWRSRWPELPAPAFDSLLEALGDPPSYQTPQVRPAHTRHYMPGVDHKTGAPGGTDLTLDPYLSISRKERLLVRWDADLTAEQRAHLGKLAELLPYVGRADSICDAALLERDPTPDETWWRPSGGSGDAGFDSGSTGRQTARLLASAQPVRRSALEVSTHEVRKARRTLPPETTWITYARKTPSVAARRRPDGPLIEAIRLAVVGAAPIKATHGILLADVFHERAADVLAGDRAGMLLGRDGAATDHRHLHWVPIPDQRGRGATIGSLLVWAPDGMRPDEVSALLRVRAVSGRRGRGGEDGYDFRGLPPVDLLLQAAGTIGQVAPELCGPARRWRSLTPYLPVRHRKRESLDDFMAADIRAELRYRGLGEATVTRVDPDDGLSDRWARDFRRHRMKERLSAARRGLGLRLTFPEEVAGPLLLGQLSHFGYGAFEPEPG